MSLFTIDQGNTNSTIVEWINGAPNQVNEISSVNSPVLVSNVKGTTFPDSFTDIKNIPHLFDHLDMDIHYEKSLGVDRLMAAYGIFKKEECKSVLCIDAGTFTTVDHITHLGFQGGLILPGNHLLERTYHQGHAFHDVKVSLKPANHYPFQTTTDCLNSSISFMLAQTYKSIILSKKIDKIYLSGGNANFHVNLIESLQSNVTITLDNQLVHKGLFELSKTLEKKEVIQ